MGKYAVLGNKHDEVPFYLVDDTTYAPDDAEILADMAAEGYGAPIGTIIATGTLSAYTSASKYPSSSTYSYIEE